MAENCIKSQYLLKIMQNIKYFSNFKYSRSFCSLLAMMSISTTMKNEKGKNIFKSGLKMHLKRFKNQNSALRALQAPTRLEICTFIDLAEFIREMAENIHTFGRSPIFSYGHPDYESWVEMISMSYIRMINKSS